MGTLASAPAPAEAPPRSVLATGLARTLVRVDATLRVGLALAWLALAAAPATGSGAAALTAVLGACGALALLGVLPRVVAAAGLALSLAVLARSSGVATELGLPLAAAAWALVRLGPASGWLREVRRLTRARALHLVACELARARASAASDDAEVRGLLSRAGDAYERAGRTLEALERSGVPRGLSAAATRRCAALLARALGAAPGLRSALERRLGAASRSSSVRA